MKANKIIFWILASLFSAMMLMSASMYIMRGAMVVNGIKAAGFPEFMLNILATAKICGVVSLLQPKFPKLREWAYAGFTCLLICAAWTHIVTNTPSPIGPIIFLVVLGISYYLNTKIIAAKQAA